MRRWRALVSLLTSAVLALAPAATGWELREGKELLGTRAPEWRDLQWVNGGPLRLADLAGKVVLVRFWTTGCGYCEATAPALRDLALRYRERGMVVVAIHHPKSEAGRDLAAVRRAAEALGPHVAVAQDLDWRTARSYGVGSVFTRFTSVSTLIDRDGIIRFVHDGGEYHPGDAPGHETCGEAHRALHAAVESVLGGRGPGT